MGLADWKTAIEKNHQGIEELEAELNGAAQKSFIESIAESDQYEANHLNLGLTFELDKELKKALSEYLVALKKTKDPQLKFASLFNAARVFGETKQVGMALAFYQKALEMKPDSREVKTNIELLIKKQQQQGGGGSKNDKKDKKDNKKDQKKKDDEKNKDDPNRKVVNRREKQPKPFKSKELSKKDVDQILQELKNQEQKIRKEQNKKSSKEKPRDKDW